MKKMGGTLEKHLCGLHSSHHGNFGTRSLTEETGTVLFFQFFWFANRIKINWIRKHACNYLVVCQGVQELLLLVQLLQVVVEVEELRQVERVCRRRQFLQQRVWQERRVWQVDTSLGRKNYTSHTFFFHRNLHIVFALCGRFCKPPTVWSFQKVAPTEDRWHCKCIRVPLHWKVRSEEGGNVSQESKVGLHKARVPNPLAHGTSEAKISLGCSKKQNWNVTISIWNQGFRVQESERELSRCVWRSSLESKVWISERKPEGSGDRRADKATVEKRMKSWPTYHLNVKY